MLELARIDTSRPRRVSPHAHDSQPSCGLALGLARTADEVEQAQRLRYEVFSQELGAVFPGSGNGIDVDRYDAWCEHLLVCELGSGRVVGTYRILTPEQARRAGSYYSENEFDLTALDALRSGLAELGRSCTHPDHRGGAAIMLLWSGVAEFLRRGGYRHVFGCASVSLRDEGAAAARVYRESLEQMARDPSLRVTPHHPLPLARFGCSDLPGRVPPLIKGYFNLGARICGEPAWDPDFHTADFPMLLDVAIMDTRYQRRFHG
jgi:putative hemolysin